MDLVRPARSVLFAALAAGLATGCAFMGFGAVPAEPVNIQKVEYYPFQVKGYQNTYPKKSMVVLMPTDGRELKDGVASAAGAPPGTIRIGETTGKSGEIVQRIYNEPLATVVQHAIGRSAEEAGMTPYAAPQSDYESVRATQREDYVLASKIKRAWVHKRRGADSRFGPTWKTVADFSLEVTIYKPPFKLPFWEGTSSATYNDPPLGTFGLGPEDETGIYEDPGQVLSVALTRAVAGIFDRDDLRALITEDAIKTR